MRLLTVTVAAFALTSAHGSFQEDAALWGNIDAINEALEVPGAIQDSELERLFQNAVETVLSADLHNQIEDLRGDAFASDDFSVVDAYVERALPSIKIMLLGESNSIGVNVEYFLGLAAPGTGAYDFFDLALDGFYVNGFSGTAELPVWMERGASSFQAVTDSEIAGAYAEIWQVMSIGFQGYYLYVAEQTINSLGGVPDLSDSELLAYYQVYSDPFVIHVRTALNNYLSGSDEGLYSASSLSEQLETFREYLSHRFVVLSIDPAGMGGYSILLISEEKPDRIFEAWVYTLSSGDLELREFSESDQFSGSEVAGIAERYRSFLADREHSI